MEINNKAVIKFTKDDIRNVYLRGTRYDVWAEITLKSGVEIRSHSTELQNLLLSKYKSYVAFGARVHTFCNFLGTDEKHVFLVWDCAVFVDG